MTYELMIQAREAGQVWECSPSTESITYTTNRTGSPGTLKFVLIQSDGISFSEGDPVRFSVDGTLVFYGYVFTRSVDRWGVMTVTAYDQLRYLKANASYAFYSASAGDIIRQIAEDFELTVGTLADTGFLLPSYIQEDKSCLDIISGAVQQTLLNTGEMYVFYDAGGVLTLAPAREMIAPVVIGSSSLMGDYTYKCDIDAQTYNRIKLVRPNKDTGHADTYVAQNPKTLQQWGLLQYYSTVDEALNEAQITALAQEMLEFYDQPYQTFSASSLGVVGVRAGQMLWISLPEAGIVRQVLLDRVTYTFRQDFHTMDFETLTLSK